MINPDHLIVGVGVIFMVSMLYLFFTHLIHIKSDQIDPEDYGWTAKDPGNLRKVYFKGEYYLYYTHEKTWVVQYKDEYFNSWTAGSYMNEETMEQIEEWIASNTEDV